MEELEGIHGAELGSDPEFHEIPTQGSSHTSQATYIRAPSQGLPTTTTTNQVFESPNKFNENHGGGSFREMLKMPEYHNPDPLVRLIGELMRLQQ